MQAGYDAEYLRRIFDFIVYTISCMEAPARRESTQKVCPHNIFLNSYVLWQVPSDIPSPGVLGD